MIEADNPTSHSYFSQRLRLHYLDWGNEGAPHALLLHGIRDHCHTWDWIAQRLRTRFHVVAPDLRGHGDSEWPLGGGYGHLDYVYDIAQLVRQARLNPLVIIGHSMGGTLACLYAGIYPERVTRLVVLEGVGQWHHFARRAAPHERLAQWVDGMRGLAGRLAKRYPDLDSAYRRMHETNPHLSAEQARHLTIHGTNQNEDGSYSWKFDNYTHVRPPYDITADDTAALWRRIACPVLFINSKQGYPHRIGQDGTLGHFGQARLVDIDKAGHWTHHDQLDAVMVEIDAFLAD